MASNEKLPQQALDLDVSQIAGNAPTETKQLLAYHLTSDVKGFVDGFVHYIGTRARLTEVSLAKKEEEPEKVEGRVVCEIVVGADMVNGMGNMHGGCTAYLIDLCTTFSILVYNHAVLGIINHGVSQSMNIIYHAPAPLNDKLRIVNKTITVGGRTMSARVEIWSTTSHRLVASGTHIKMQPSGGKQKARL